MTQRIFQWKAVFAAEWWLFSILQVKPQSAPFSHSFNCYSRQLINTTILNATILTHSQQWVFIIYWLLTHVIRTTDWYWLSHSVLSYCAAAISLNPYRYQGGFFGSHVQIALCHPSVPYPLSLFGVKLNCSVICVYFM